MKPLISIITINHNNDSGLERTILSVINQTHHNFQYLVIDGGSTDRSVEIINKYKDRMHYAISEPDEGIYHAMNKGILKATGEYLLFLNSGDELINPEIIESIQSNLSGSDIIYFDLLLINNSQEEIKRYPNLLSFQYFLIESLPHPATFIKRELLLKAGGYNQNLKICSDWEFFIVVICKQDASYKHIPVALSKFNLDGISSSIENRKIIASEKQIVIANHFEKYIEMIHELEKNKKLNLFFENSRIVKLARTLGFLKPRD